MLTVSLKEKFNIWCLEESDTVYWDYYARGIGLLSSPFESQRYIDSGTNKLLGPVCLGFWRG